MEETDTNVFTHLFPKTIYAMAEPAPLTFTNFENNAIQLPELLVLVKNAFYQPIPESDRALLVKMVDWMGVARQKAAVFSMSDETVSFLELRKHHQIENIIGYGVTPQDIGLQLEFRINKPLHFMNCNMIFTESFAEVQKKESLKKEFFREAGKLFSHLKQEKE